MSIQEYSGSRSNSISSFSSIDSAGNTTVEGETDSEKEILSDGCSIKTTKDCKITNMHLINKFNCTTLSVKTSDSKKRGRCKKLGELDSSQPRKRTCSALKYDSIKVEEDEHFYDLFNFDHHGEEDLDASIVHLLDRIEWDEDHDSEGHLSRCSSPFTTTASFLSSTINQPDGCLINGFFMSEESNDAPDVSGSFANEQNAHYSTFVNVMEELKALSENDPIFSHHLHHRTEKKLLPSIHSLTTMSNSHAGNEMGSIISAGNGSRSSAFLGDEKQPQHTSEPTGSYIPLLYADFDTWSSAVSSSVTA